MTNLYLTTPDDKDNNNELDVFMQTYVDAVAEEQERRFAIAEAMADGICVDCGEPCDYGQCGQYKCWR